MAIQILLRGNVESRLESETVFTKSNAESLNIALGQTPNSGVHGSGKCEVMGRKSTQWWFIEGFLMLITLCFLSCSPGGSQGKESACSVGDPGLIPGLGRSPGEGNSNQLQPSCLENSHGQRSLVGYIVHGVSKSQT